MTDKKTTPLTYRSAGVHIDAGNKLINRIKSIAKTTDRPEVFQSIGGFAALFELPIERYKKPLLVSATDGVGTKLKLALTHQMFQGIGIDLVAMCVNDLIVCGAEPLFFLDYYATGQLDIAIAEQIIQSIAMGCQTAGMSLIGGETAEMPGLYAGHDFDLAGFAVGIVEKDRLIDGSQVQVGDQLIGIASSGCHANGYSLIRKIIANQNGRHIEIEGKPLNELLLIPTKIYTQILRALTIPCHAIAHITGGGLLENIPRVLPAHTQAIINPTAWPEPPLFTWLKNQGNLSEDTYFRTFNCGIGLVLCIAPEQTQACLENIKQQGETAWIIGSIARSNRSQPTVLLKA